MYHFWFAVCIKCVSVFCMKCSMCEPTNRRHTECGRPYGPNAVRKILGTTKLNAANLHRWARVPRRNRRCSEEMAPPSIISPGGSPGAADRHRSGFAGGGACNAGTLGNGWVRGRQRHHAVTSGGTCCALGWHVVTFQLAVAGCRVAWIFFD